MARVKLVQDALCDYSPQVLATWRVLDRTLKRRVAAAPNHRLNAIEQILRVLRKGQWRDNSAVRRRALRSRTSREKLY